MTLQSIVCHYQKILQLLYLVISLLLQVHLHCQILQDFKHVCASEVKLKLKITFSFIVVQKLKLFPLKFLNNSYNIKMLK